MPKRILLVVTNVKQYEDPSHPTGLWLSELTHAWHIFKDHGLEQTIVSPLGGLCPLEPRSLKFPNYDKTAKAWLADPACMALLEHTSKPDDLESANFDAIFFTGGHAVMFDFPDSGSLQKITKEIFEQGMVISSVCHGYCGLLNVKLSDGSYLIAGRKMTGFAWSEEVLAGVSKMVPYNAEEEVKKRGAKYQKGTLPFLSYTVIDGLLARILDRQRILQKESFLLLVKVVRVIKVRVVCNDLNLQLSMDQSCDLH
ncbi:glutathione-independent glyoxalase HSP31 [Trichoderma asperellum]|uniref:D-lactate dehydratase n=1 Tax=Trichoderma asperellum TaxID=101201 RepID=A0A6V8QPT4_TRIAP|nr:glutathione-independent glyoxalase HSP31 [Trichoderma asperellum]